MKVKDVPQDIVFYEDIKKIFYALDNKGKYVGVASTGWSVEDVANGQAVEDMKVHLEKTRQEVLKGLKSPLVYHMEKRQMTPEILAKTVGLFTFIVRRHFRPEVFSRLKPSLLEQYARGLALTVQELKCVPDK